MRAIGTKNRVAASVLRTERSEKGEPSASAAGGRAAHMTAKGRVFDARPTQTVTARRLEAAHIRVMTEADDNRPENGLLLRADIHTLFDLDLLGIHPEELTVHLHKSIKFSEYSECEGKQLAVGDARPSKESLQTRFESFQK